MIEFIQSLHGNVFTYIVAPTVEIPCLAAKAIAFCSACEAGHKSK